MTGFLVDNFVSNFLAQQTKNMLARVLVALCLISLLSVAWGSKTIEKSQSAKNVFRTPLLRKLSEKEIPKNKLEENMGDILNLVEEKKKKLTKTYSKSSLEPLNLIEEKNDEENDNDQIITIIDSNQRTDSIDEKKE